MCRFDASICGYPLSTGSIIIVLYHIFLSWNLIVVSATLLQQGSSDDPEYKLSGESETMLRSVLIFGLFSNVTLLFLLILIIKRIKIAAFLLLIYMSIWVFSTVSGVILSVLISEKPFSPIFLFHTVIDIYCWLIVYNFYMET